MDAKNLMHEVSSRISELDLGDAYQQSKDFVSRTADQVRDLYHRTEEKLPEGSMKYAGLALAGLTIGVASYRLGKSRERGSPVRAPMQRMNKVTENARDVAEEGMSSAKEAARSASRSMEKIDFTPLYKLAKLWLIYKISL